MNLQLEARSYDINIDHHYHNYGQLIIPDKGMMKITTKAHNIQLNNQVFYLPRETTHEFSGFTGNQFLVVDIPGNYQDEWLGQLKDKEQLIDMNHKWLSIRTLLKYEMKRFDHTAIKQLLSYAFSDLKRTHVAKSIAYIHEHYRLPIKVEQLAEIENYHVSSYIEWFKKTVGMTPNAYIQQLRLKEAKRLMLESDYSLNMIAQLVGYQHQSSLTRLFKKHGLNSPIKLKKEALSK